MIVNWNIILLLIAGLLLSSCGSNATNKEDKQETPEPTKSETPEQVEAPDYKTSDDMRAPITDIDYLFDPIVLDGQTTVISLTDFIQDVSKITSISSGPGLECAKSADGKTVNINIIGDIGYYEVLTLQINDKTYDVLLENPTKKPVTLRLRDFEYSDVRIRGIMNNWISPGEKMQLRNGFWEASYKLAPGAYQYIFVVDGKDMLDPKNPTKAATSDGSQVSVLSLTKQNADSLPVIKVGDSEPGTIKMEVDYGGVPIVFWQNHRLEAKRTGNIYTVNIPEASKDVANSSLRIYAQNEYGAGSSRLYNLAGNQIQ